MTDAYDMVTALYTGQDTDLIPYVGERVGITVDHPWQTTPFQVSRIVHVLCAQGGGWQVGVWPAIRVPRTPLRTVITLTDRYGKALT